MSLQAERVRWSQRGTLIIDGVDLRIVSGEFLGVLGPNGSGKSSLLRLLAGIRTPDAGRVNLDGDRLADLSNRGRARRIAFVEQENASDADMSVLEVALLGRIPHRGPFDGVSEAERELARRALDIVGLGEMADREWSTLSGGERQRTVIARALTQQPTELLLDEFTNHLDVKHQLGILELLSRAPSTVVAALHDLNLAASYCDRIVLLKGGRVVASGTPAEVITAERVAAVYGVTATVEYDESGIPAVRFIRESSLPPTQERNRP